MAPNCEPLAGDGLAVPDAFDEGVPNNGMRVLACGRGVAEDAYNQ